MTVLAPASIGQGPIPHGIEAGDVILTAPQQPDALDGLIFAAQQFAFPVADAAFTHAAVYVANGTIADSMPGRLITSRPFADLTRNSFFRVLRLKGIGPAAQWDVSNAAINLQGGYSFVQAAADALVQVSPLPSHWKQMLAELFKLRNDYYYCSQYVNEVYLAGIQVTVVDRRSFVPLPAAFSVSPLFEDVQVHW